ncbi:family 20 glycoside hydrolase [Halteromyces radiatus]|uniref:family 20 glycoside hydrolase n=1 Tax=Halteromyces radiatus TaxID=101107 RepID=UPI00221E8AF8|nr:family 20 glycoside hydrolase [Halteromyces radiatus]KAI8098746.1 family 20 glycoside hydrolase [Halteromyces radiatus]
MTEQYNIYNDMMNQDSPIQQPLSSVLLVLEQDSLPVTLQDGINKIKKHIPYQNLVFDSEIPLHYSGYKWYPRFQYDPNLRAGQVQVESGQISSCFDNTLQQQQQKFEILIRYNRQIEAFRGLGRLLGAARHPSIFSGNHDHLINFTEQSRFDTQGVMVDCSRNGVLKVKNVKQLLCYMAMMGLNMLQLYTEDTYEVEGEPLFGYMRGKYTRRELCRIDDYAYDLGIEVIPCIQTLGHLGQILQWPNYSHLRDNSEVLLAGSEATYEFIEKLISSATGPFRSKRIHLGMDEAYGLGEGRYRQIFGYKEPTQIFTYHLQRVMEICSRYGVQPMIWSDMLFCLAAKSNSLQGYYDQGNNPATPELVESMPENIDLIFWDYYHTSEDDYSQKLQQHRDLGCSQPWLASGAWTWSRFWTALPFTFQTIRASLLAAKNKDTGVKNAFITIWGDEGNECDVFSSLPGIHYYAQLGYCDDDDVDLSVLKYNFDAICGGNFDDWVYASKIDDSPSGNPITTRTHFSANPSKWLLWEDPMLGFLTPQYNDEDMETHYGEIAHHLFTAFDHVEDNHDMQLEDPIKQYPLNNRLELPARVAMVLSLKCQLRQRCAAAYRARDYAQLYDLTTNRLTQLRNQVEALWQYHRRLWMTMYKPFGWEVLELRYGGLMTRLATMYDRLMAYLTKKNKTLGDDDSDEDDDNSLAEFDIDLQCLFYGSKTNMLLDYSRVVTPSRPG